MAVEPAGPAGPGHLRDGVATCVSPVWVPRAGRVSTSKPCQVSAPVGARPLCGSVPGSGSVFQTQHVPKWAVQVQVGNACASMARSHMVPSARAPGLPGKLGDLTARKPTPCGMTHPHGRRPAPAPHLLPRRALRSRRDAGAVSSAPCTAERVSAVASRKGGGRAAGGAAAAPLSPSRPPCVLPPPAG